MAIERKYNKGILIQHSIEQTSVVKPSLPIPDISDSFFEYDYASKTWTELPTMQKGRAGFLLQGVDNGIYAIGGIDGSAVLKSCEVYNGDWSSVGEMPEAKAFFASAVVGNDIYVIGGITSNAFGDVELSKTVYKYSSTSNIWSQMADLPQLNAFSVAFELSGNIYVLSGYSNQMNKHNKVAYIYNIQNNAWTSTADFPSDVLSIYSKVLPFSFKVGNLFYVISGLKYQVNEETEVKEYTTSSYVFNPSNLTVQSADFKFNNFPRARFSGASVVWGNKMLLMGGINSISNTLKWIESINSSTNPFAYESYDRLPKGKSSFSATTWQDEYGTNRLYVAGGLTSNTGTDFLKIDLFSNENQINLDGKQTGYVEVALSDENGESPASVNVKLMSDQYPVLLTEDAMEVLNGSKIVTVLPRSDDFASSMGTNGERNFSANFFGYITDPSYNGKTTATNLPGTGYSTTTPSSVDISDVYPVDILKQYISVLSTTELTQGSYLRYDSIGGFIYLRPLSFSGGTSTSVKWRGNRDWMPVTNAIFTENSASYEDLMAVLDRMKETIPFGGTAILDSIDMALNSIEMDESNNSKLLMVYSDDMDNLSFTSQEQLIEKNKRIASGRGKDVPILASIYSILPKQLSISKGFTIDDPILGEIALQSGGSYQFVYDEDQIEQYSKNIFLSNGFLSKGKFSLTLDLGKEVYIQDINSLVTFPDADGHVTFRYALGDDIRRYSALSDNFLPNQTASIKRVARYVKMYFDFWAELTENEYALPFESPLLESVTIVYHDPQESYLHLNPIEAKNNLSQLMISLDATVPSSADVRIGVSTGANGSWKDLSNDAVPQVGENGKIVIPMRYTWDNTEIYNLEKLESIDGFVHKAQYGKWDAKATITVFNSNAQLVDSKDYSIHPEMGTIIFRSKQEDNFVLQVVNKNIIKPVIKIINRINGEKVKISGVGYFYTDTSERKNLNVSGRNLPEIFNLYINPPKPTVDSILTASYAFYDAKGRPELGSLIRWYVNESVQDDLNDLKQWDNKDFDLLVAGDVVYFTVTPRTKDSIGIPARSLPIKIS